jgi:hypothetical protein
MTTERDRPLEPEHPKMLSGGMADGDPAFMLRCIAEDYVLAGTGVDELRAMSKQPRYGALYAAWLAVGEAAAARIFDELAARLPRLRYRTQERAALPDCVRARLEGGS